MMNESVSDSPLARGSVSLSLPLPRDLALHVEEVSGMATVSSDPDPVEEVWGVSSVSVDPGLDHCDVAAGSVPSVRGGHVQFVCVLWVWVCSMGGYTVWVVFQPLGVWVCG